MRIYSVIRLRVKHDDSHYPRYTGECVINIPAIIECGTDALLRGRASVKYVFSTDPSRYLSGRRSAKFLLHDLDRFGPVLLEIGNSLDIRFDEASSEIPV